MRKLDFVIRMAWRDSRTSRWRLLFFSLSITLGVAALVAIGSIRRSLAQAINDQARTLVGADLVVSSSHSFSPEAEKLLANTGASQAHEIRFSTMAVFPGRGTRLVNLRALQGDFPFYGRVETAPAGVARLLPERGNAIVDENLMFQFGRRTGDQISLGGRDFRIAATLKKVPGDAGAGASFAPRVYISLADLPALSLLGPGSVARYRAYLKFAAGTDVSKEIAALTPELERVGLQWESVEKRKRDLGESLENLYRFLNLVSFISLLLGAVGIGSAIQAHLRQKVRSGAILRCLGSSAAGSSAIYLVQVAAMALSGALLGGALGFVVQLLLPRVLQPLLPMEIPVVLSFPPIVSGVLAGFAICLLFALPALLRFRKVSPLLTLRTVVQENHALGRDPLLLGAYLSLAAAIAGFSIWQSQSWQRGLVFTLALGLAVASFVAVAFLLLAVMRRFPPRRMSFAWRQGLANLHRPHNRTLLLLVSLGLGTFLLLTLQLTRQVLLAQFQDLDRANQPNIFLFDIQGDQREGVARLVQSLGFPIIQRAPIVTMRLTQVKGKQTAALLANPAHKIPEWELQREYRSTFRDNLANTERIAAGQWIGHFDYHPGEAVPISLDRDIARDLEVGLGDELVFDVQGVPMRTRVASVRKIDWKRFQTNFFVVFPTGVLENAPGFEVLVTRAATPADSARLQNAVVRQYPNVSAIDLATVLQTVDSILGKVALAIRVMSLFTITTGLLVVGSAIASGRYQRVQESILLRTLGASRRQIWQILAAEYFFLGLLASLTGTLLAIAASWALARFVFDLDYAPNLLSVPLAIGVATVLTTVIGLLSSRGVKNVPPLDILRAEAELA